MGSIGYILAAAEERHYATLFEQKLATRFKRNSLRNETRHGLIRTPTAI
jgi:hypothetical protein